MMHSLDQDQKIKGTSYGQKVQYATGVDSSPITDKETKRIQQIVGSLLSMGGQLTQLF